MVSLSLKREAARIDAVLQQRQDCGMGQARRPRCPECGAPLLLAPSPGGNGPRTFRCLDCERPDPFKMDQIMGWLRSELQPPK